VKRYVDCMRNALGIRARREQVGATELGMSEADSFAARRATG
jgi:hypothetical protein